MRKIKYFIFFLCLCLCQKTLIAEEQGSNWLNKKLLKLEVLSDEHQNSPIITNNQTVSSIALGELVEEKINLPYYYWSWSKIEDIINKIQQIRSTTNPITRELIIAVLTSEMPVDLTKPDEAKLYVTRLNKLLTVKASDNVVRLLPPLILNSNECEEGLFKIRSTCEMF